MRASSTRDPMLSLRKAWRRWWATVWVLMYMRPAVCWLVRPWAVRSATARSVPVRLSPVGRRLCQGAARRRQFRGRRHRQGRQFLLRACGDRGLASLKVCGPSRSGQARADVTGPVLRAIAGRGTQNK
jgi:hypothetical protein